MRNGSRFFLTFVALPALLFCCFSCTKPLGIGPTSNTIAVVGKVPVIDLPTRPVLESLDPDELVEYNKLSETVRKKLQGNDKKLKLYAAQLQVGIEDYNTYAAVRNKTSDESVGVKGK